MEELVIRGNSGYVYMGTHRARNHVSINIKDENRFTYIDIEPSDARRFAARLIDLAARIDSDPMPTPTNPVAASDTPMRDDDEPTSGEK